jgi:hypothetical protein
MTREKTYVRTIEVAVKMPDLGLSRRKLNALKKVFKNKLVATFGGVQAARRQEIKSSVKTNVKMHYKSMTR